MTDPAEHRTHLGLFMSSPILGGAEQYFKDLAHQIDRRRFEVFIYYDYWPAFERFLELDGLARTHERAMRHLGLAWRLADGPAALVQRGARKLAAWLLAPVSALRLWRLFRADRLELLHVNNGGYPGSLSARLAVLAGRAAGCRCVMTVCGTPERVGRMNLPARIFDAAIAHALDCGIVLSRHMAAKLRQRYGFAGVALEIIPFGVAGPAAGSEPKPTKSRVGMVANFLPYKGHRYLLESVGQLAGEFPGLEVVLIGGGPEREAVERAIRRRGLEEMFRLVGPVSNREARQWMGRFDLLVLPSETEGLPYAIIEAMSHGKPVVAFAAGGIPELVAHNETGFVIPVGNVPGLTGCLRALLADAGLRARMGERSRRRFRELYTLEAMVSRTEAVYDRLPGARR